MIIIMGVAGSGKSTVGRALAASLGWPFFDADDYHRPAQVAKMAAGIPLDDDDRRPWLETLRDVLAAQRASGHSAVLACSALRESYRAILRGRADDVRFVHLQGSYEDVLELLQRRAGHFMKPGMLASQFAALEPPRDALTLSVRLSCAEQVLRIREAFALRNPQDAGTDGKSNGQTPGGHPVMAQADIAVIGLAVMGENLILNMAGHGFTVAAFNRTVSKVDDFLNGRARGLRILGARSLPELVGLLQRPRRVMMMVKAGAAVDDLIRQLVPLLEPGDILIDGGNTHYPDTERRVKEAEARGLLYVGAGVSGGEEGALRGPSIMPGGSRAAWPHIKPIFQAMAARTDRGEPCCEWVGDGGAGHFVKMVHNGIEYGDMQLIAETYHMMKQGLGMTNAEMHEAFKEWNETELNSYLIEITRDILAYRDEQGNEVIDLILDAAGQKGTGKWTVLAALDTGMPLTLIGEAVFARCLSAAKEERVAASQILAGARPAPFKGNRAAFVKHLKRALYASKIVSYAQGYQLLRAAAREHGWNLNYGDIALIWRGGCIIRSAFLGNIKKAFVKNPDLVNLLLDPFFAKATRRAQSAWRKVVALSAKLGIPMPAVGSALAYYDGYRCARLPAHLLQAQRDYFGAHTYERVDQPRGVFFHTNWTGRGGATASTAYEA